VTADGPIAHADGPDLIGYASRFSVEPGEELAFMVSAAVEQAEARLVRLVHGDERSPIGLVEHELDSALDGTWELESQPVHAGSFGVVEGSDALTAASGERIAGHVFAFPTLVARAEPQGLLAHARADGRPGWSFALEAGGDLVLRVLDADGAVCGEARLDAAVTERAWHALAFSLDRPGGRLDVWSTPLDGVAVAGATRHATGTLDGARAVRCDGPLLLAAERLVPRHGEPRAAGTWNGKLERPLLVAGTLDETDSVRLAAGAGAREVAASVLVDLDLGSESDTWLLTDRSPLALAARVYNAPMRACTSRAWRGAAIAPPLDRKGYAAIHFHDDDVHHADWRPARAWVVPDDLPSGIYAVRLRGGGAEDRIPFVVRPPREGTTAPVALWLSSFTYAAYANARKCLVGKPSPTFVPEEPSGDRLLARHPEWGGSAYDLHSDGSGISISTLARPVPNLRPTHRPSLVNAPRHFGADLYLAHWLEHAGVAYDVIADEDVHAQGAGLLERYATVVTSSHPEYVTSRILDAVEQYENGGGRLMYMGGNGFYWVTGAAPESEITVEVRRGRAGTRTWESSPGEEHLQLTGEPGGLWRYRGRPPHGLVGIGFVSEGWDGVNRPYRRGPGSFEPAGAWVFEGIGADEPIGDAGLVMGGAAGDEIDSADAAYGTPAETLVLASSWGHGGAYRLVVEDMKDGIDAVQGPCDELLRADVTLTPRRNRGAVFAVGSISFAGSLSHDGYENPLARMCGNVLRAFVSGESPWATACGAAPAA
jgi:N,N-dimethylformamidase